MTTIGQRVRMIRKSDNVHMTLEKFGERIGLKKNSLSQIENDLSSLTDQTKLSICREFNVNQHWLETGEGEMFLNSSDISLDDFAKAHGASESELRILRTYFELDPEVRQKVLAHFRDRMADEEQPQSDMANYKKAIHESLDRQLDLEESREDGSSVSSAV